MNSTERNKLHWQRLKANPEKLKQKQIENLEFYYKNRDVILEKMRKKYHEKKDRDMFQINDEEKVL
jgi:hypothetical protein